MVANLSYFESFTTKSKVFPNPRSIMPSFKVAHIHEQGIDLIIIPLSSTFEYKLDSEKKQITYTLQRRANATGLRGTVVPV